MSGKLKTIYVLYAFLAIIIGGTLGYRIIEGWSWVDSFFMTIITITTVGYREVGGELSTTGKFFTSALIFSGFGVAYIGLSGLAAMFIRGELNTVFGRIRMQKEIKNMKGHYIIAGYGRTGQVIGSHLKLKEIPFVVIDNLDSALQKLREENIPFIQGEASNEQSLDDAGIRRAKGFISVVSTDAENAFAIMTAKGMNPNLIIMARALDSQSIRKLKMAGANKVIAPYILGGLRIAHAVTHPHAADFIDVMEDVQSKQIEMADFFVAESSKLNGIKLKDSLVREAGVIAVGVRKPDGQFIFQPSAETVFVAGDHLIVMGPTQNIAKLNQEYDSKESHTI